MSILDEPLTHFIGRDGFVWWMGIVENLDTDILASGRTKVRIFGWHDMDPNKVGTLDLPWAYPLMPVTHATLLPNYKPGDWVVGFFMDAKRGQQPIIIGVLPAIPQSPDK
jgi:hypothetical protein